MLCPAGDVESGQESDPPCIEAHLLGLVGGAHRGDDVGATALPELVDHQPSGLSGGADHEHRWERVTSHAGRGLGGLSDEAKGGEAEGGGDGLTAGRGRGRLSGGERGVVRWGGDDASCEGRSRLHLTCRGMLGRTRTRPPQHSAAIFSSAAVGAPRQ